MSLLEGIVKQVVTQTLQNATKSDSQNSQNQSSLGGLLGSLAGALGQSASNPQGANQNHQASAANSSDLGGLLGSVLGGVLGNNQQGNNRQNAPAQTQTDLGSILGGVLGAQKSGGLDKGALLVALLPVVLAFIQKNGGLSGVLNKFNGAGLGAKAQSWVDIDKDNDGIDAVDVARLFGDDEIGKLSAQTGASETQVCQGIAELLPEVVNELTPQGDLQHEAQANDEIDQLLAQIKPIV